MSLTNFEMMKKRLKYEGGYKQEERMIEGKYKSFLKSLYYSYQGCDVRPVQKFNICLQESAEPTFPQYRALINPDKLKQDYDDKILSIDYNTELGPGDVFQWIGTSTYWLVYMQALTEDAYFRGEIRRCKYKIKFKDEEGQENYTWAAIRGPVETQIASATKNNIGLDTPNYTLHILMPLNDKTIAAFDRYSEFLFGGKCWQVQATDTISTKNVLELTAKEHYINKDTDDVDKELADGLVIEPVNPTPQSKIIGETFIKPKITEIFKAPESGGKWSVLEDFPVCIVPIDDVSIELTWQKSTSGQFTLQWSKDNIIETKVIVVESLF